LSRCFDNARVLRYTLLTTSREAIMAKRKKTEEQSPAAEATPPAAEETAPAALPSAEASATPPPAYAPVAAPEKAGPAYTVDHRLGYRKEETADGTLQIRFAQRPDGSRPDDELLAPVRGKQPDVQWANRAKAWQARTPEGVEALDAADDELAAIGRKRSEGRSR
jgi:hypothetical protein